MGLADYQRVPLLFGPSPVHRLERLERHLGGRVEIWAKREDCNSGLAYGGNKVRKLEYLVADALAEQERALGLFFDTIVVCAVTGSTHAGMLAGFAAQERPRSVLGIDGSARVEQTWEQIARIARFTAEAIGLGRELRDDEVML